MDFNITYGNNGFTITQILQVLKSVSHPLALAIGFTITQILQVLKLCKGRYQVRRWFYNNSNSSGTKINREYELILEGFTITQILQVLKSLS